MLPVNSPRDALVEIGIATTPLGAQAAALSLHGSPASREMNDQPDHSEGEQDVNATGGDMESSPCDEPPRQKNQKQHQEDEVRNQTHIFVLPWPPTAA